MLSLDPLSGQIIQDGRRAAGQCVARCIVIEGLGHRDCATARSDVAMPGLEFMIAHERDAMPVNAEATHAVGAIGNHVAVIHAISKARDRTIGKAARQIEQLGRVGLKRAVAGYHACTIVQPRIACACRDACEGE